MLASAHRRAWAIGVERDDVGHQGGGSAFGGQIAREVGQAHQGREALRDGAGRVGVALRVHDDFVVLDGAEVYLDALNLSAGANRFDVEDLLAAEQDVDEVDVVQLIRLAAVGMHRDVVVEALGQQVDHHRHGEAIQPQDVGGRAGRRAGCYGEHVVLALVGVLFQAAVQGVLEDAHHGFVDAEHHIIFEHVVGGLGDVVADVAHAIGRDGCDIGHMHARFQGCLDVGLHLFLILLHICAYIEGTVRAMTAQVVGVHQLGLGRDWLAVDEL